MKTLKTLMGGLLAFTLFATTVISAQASKFEEGKHYTVN